MDELADMLKDLTINDAEYYASKSATKNDVKGNPASNPKTVTHTSDRKGKVTDTSNGKIQQKLVGKQTLPVVVLMMNLSIEKRIAPIGGYYQTLLPPATKEVVEDAACGMWVNWTPGQIIQTGVNGSTPGYTGMYVRSKPAPSPVLIESPTISS